MEDVRVASRAIAIWITGLFLLIAVFSAIGTNVTAQGSTWTVREVDILEVQSSQLVIDHNDRIHICYNMWNGVMRYATNSNPYGNWSIVQVADSAVRGLSFVLDSNNKAHISYYVGGAHQLMYATNANGPFVSQLVDDDYQLGTASSIAIDASSAVHISYVKSSKLMYSTNAGGSWNKTEIFDPTRLASEPTSIEVGTDGVVHIVYQAIELSTLHSLRHIWKEGSTWKNETIAGNGLHFTSDMTLDNLDRPQVAYVWQNASDPSQLNLMHSLRGASGWSDPFLVNGLPSTPTSLSMITDASNEVHMSYDQPGGLFYASSAGGWGVENVVASSGAGTGSSIGIDANGKAFISYYDIGDSVQIRLKYATTATLASDPWSFTATPGSKKFSLHWNQPNSTGDYPRIGYTVKVYNQDPNIGVNLQPIISIGIPEANTSHVVTGLYNGAEYWVQVMANSRAGEGASSPLLYVVPGDPPTAPTSFMAAAEHNNITLLWYPPLYSNSSAVTNYSILWGLSTTTMTNEVVLGDELTFVHHDLLLGQYYYYKVRARNGYGWGPYTQVVGAQALGYPPQTPTGLVAIGEDSQIVLTWNAPPMGYLNPVESYLVYKTVYDDQAPSYVIATVANGTLTYTDTQVSSGNNYYYAVVAKNQYGQSPQSDVATAIPLGQPNYNHFEGDWLCIASALVIGLAAAGLITIYWRRSRGHG